MTPEELKAEADANNAAWRCGTFDTMQDASMTIEDMEKVIKFHEEELAAEDERVKGTDEYPNYGDDFADMVHIARRLLDTMKVMEQERDEARRMYCEAVILHGTAHRFDANGVPEEITEAEELARRLKWDCFKENTNDR